MKVILTMYLCSVVQLECMAPYTYPDKYNDLYSCMISGYTKAYSEVVKIGKDEINSKMLFIKFRCTQLHDEEKDA